MKKLLASLALITSFLAGTAYAGTAFFSHEIETGGMTKQCVYDYLGNTYVITISAVKLCPMSIDV
jgi:hypothetical protein